MYNSSPLSSWWPGLIIPSRQWLLFFPVGPLVQGAIRAHWSVQWMVAVSPVRSILPLGTRTSKTTEPSIMRMRSPNSSGRSLGVMVGRTTPASTSSFLIRVFYPLWTQCHIKVFDLRLTLPPGEQCSILTKFHLWVVHQLSFRQICPRCALSGWQLLDGTVWDRTSGVHGRVPIPTTPLLKSVFLSVMWCYMRSHGSGFNTV